MQRVDGANNVPNAFGTGKAGYQDYNPSTGQAGTTPNAAALDAMQEELASFIEYEGLTLNPADNTQLRQAIAAYVAAQIAPYETAAAATSALAAALTGLETPAEVAAAIAAALASYLALAGGTMTGVVNLYQGSTIKDAASNPFVVGYRDIPQNSQSAAYTLALSDAGKHIYHPSADTTARTWTIPANASVAFPIGTAITFVNDTSGGAITIAITSDTLVLAPTGSTGSRTLVANGVATALKVSATRWIISGSGVS